MDLNATTKRGATIVSPAGRIDHSTADELQVALQPHVDACRAGSPPVILDMSRVVLISSLGLRVLMIAAKQVGAQQGRMIVAGLTGMLREVFEISRFNRVFETFDTVDAALAAVGGSG